MKKNRILVLFIIAWSVCSLMAHAVSISGEFEIAADTHQQMTFGAAFDGSNYIVTLQGNASHPWAICAQMVSPLGDKVGSLIDLGRYGDTPIIAFDGTRYLMVWTDYIHTPNDDIYGCFISKSGVAGTPFVISSAPGMQKVAGMGFDGTNYMVVWDDYRNESSSNAIDIYAQRISTSGTLVGSEIAVCSQALDQRNATMAFDGTNFLVTYMNKRSQEPNIWDIYGNFISKAGVVGSQFKINTTDCPNSQNPIGVAYGKDGYMVVWGKDTGPGGENADAIWDVYGRVIAPNGTFRSSELAISTIPGSQAFPRVTSDGTRYFVVWTDLTHPDVEITGQFFDETGAAVTSTFPVVSGSGPRAVFATLFADGHYYLGVMEGLQMGVWGVADVYGVLVDFANGAYTTLQVSIDPGTGYLGAMSGVQLQYDLSGPQQYTGQLMINNSGKAMIDGIEPGTYSLSIYGSHWLKRVVTGVDVNGVNVVNTALANGDADGNGQINLFDYVILDSKFASSFPMADLDGDGAVNLFDYVIIDQNFGAQAD
ncbi:MAG: hypothetical protein ACYC1M_12850 [Armatimonadota bacterium]